VGALARGGRAYPLAFLPVKSKAASLTTRSGCRAARCRVACSRRRRQRQIARRTGKMGREAGRRRQRSAKAYSFERRG
jgi:hypothetical protein